MGLEHLPILVSAAGPGTNPPRIPRVDRITLITVPFLVLAAGYGGLGQEIVPRRFSKVYGAWVRSLSYPPQIGHSPLVWEDAPPSAEYLVS